MGSAYYCKHPCNYVFSANDVSVEVNAIVANARLIAAEIRRTEGTRARIESMVNREIEIKAETVIKKTFGQKVWELMKKSISAIVVAVKRWLGFP